MFVPRCQRTLAILVKDDGKDLPPFNFFEGAYMSMMSYDQQLPILSSGSLQGYLDSVQRIPILSKEEERSLFADF